jgi:hypothetical protein
MNVQISGDGTIGLSGINPFLFDLLQGIVRSGASDDPAVGDRFFPAPVEGGGERDLRDDWKALVQPELHAGFLEAREIVQADLRAADEAADGFAFQIPVRHADAWMNALSQARLALAIENRFTESELAAEMPAAAGGPRDLALLQMNFYAFLQEWLVRISD